MGPLLTWRVDVDWPATLNELLVSTVHRHYYERSEEGATKLREDEVWTGHTTAHLTRICSAIPTAVSTVVAAEVRRHALGLRHDVVAVVLGRLVNSILTRVEACSKENASNDGH